MNANNTPKQNEYEKLFVKDVVAIFSESNKTEINFLELWSTLKNHGWKKMSQSALYEWCGAQDFLETTVIDSNTVLVKIDEDVFGDLEQSEIYERSFK